MRKVDSKGNISIASKISYGMGEMTFGVVNTILSVYLMITLTDYLKVNPVWASIIVFAGIIWDAISDPLVGWLSDNWGGKHGRRRWFMLVFAVPLGICFIMLWLAASLLPGAPEAVIVVVILALYLSVFTCLTLVNVPYGSVIMEMTDDYNQRTGLTSFRMALSAVATIVAILFGDMILGENLPIYQTGGNLVYVGIVFGIFAAGATLWCYAGTFERNTYLKPPKRPRFSVSKYMFKSWKSRPFRQVAIAYLCAFTAIGLLQTLLQYYATYWLQAPSLFVILAGLVLLVAIIATPVWTFISKKIGKRNSFLLSCAVSIISFVVIFFIKPLETNGQLVEMMEAFGMMPIWGIIAVVFLGVGIGGVQLFPFSMMPDAINVSMKEGESDEGAYYGVVTFVQKLGVGVASLLIGPILNAAKYVAPPTDWPDDQLFIQPNQSAKDAILYMFVIMSIAIILIGALAVSRYRVGQKELDEKFYPPKEGKLPVEIPAVEDFPPECLC